MVVNKLSPIKITLITILSFVLIAIIGFGIYYSINNTSYNIDDSFTGPPKNYKFKKYDNLKSLESDLGFKLLNSSYFSNDNYEIIYTNTSKHSSNIYIVPKSSLKEYTQPLNETNIALFIGSFNEVYGEIYIEHSRDNTPIEPSQFLGEYEIQKPIVINNLVKAQFIKSSFPNGDYINHIMEFIHNNISYKISNIVSRDEGEKILKSFFQN